VEILSDKKPSNTQRKGEVRFSFIPTDSDKFILETLGSKQRIHRILKGQSRASGYKECVRINR
jgi:hypothetical protein